MAKEKIKRNANTTSTKKAQLNTSGNTSLKRKSKHKIRKYTLYYVLIILLTLCVGVVLSMTVFFSMENIVVVGNNKYNDDEIITVSQLKKGDNLVKIDKERAIKNILQKYIYIENVDIIRKFPSTAEINIEMVVPIAAVEHNGVYAIISKSSKVVELSSKEIPKGAMHIKGLDVKDLKLGDKLNDSANTSLKKLRDFVTQLQSTGLENIVYIDFSDNHNLKAIYDNRILIEFGENIDLSYKMEKLCLVMQQGDFDFAGSFEGVIDLSIDGQTRVRPSENIGVLIGSEIPPPILPDDEPLSR